MTWLEVLLVLAAAGVWLPTVGWLLALELVHRVRGPRAASPATDPAPWPTVALVLPVLDEARWIEDRLRDFAGLDYDRDRLELWLVDGGSRDATPARAEAAAAADPRVRLLRLENTRSKLEQVGLALEKIRAPVAVVADADVALAPDCVRELVRALEADPATGLVGAGVEPDTPLLEERLHWWWLGRLSWLEGEVAGAASVAAPCYALRPEAVGTPLPAALHADDVHLALVARSRGWRVRRAPAARARELRVPHTLGELWRFRARRGGGFVHALHDFGGRSGAPAGVRASVALRRLQLRVAPWLALGLAVAAPFAGARGVAIVLGWAIASATPLLAAARRAPAFADARRPVWRLPLAGLRLLAVGGLALLVPAAHRPAWRHPA